jgi:hypothetical protein
MNKKGLKKRKLKKACPVPLFDSLCVLYGQSEGQVFLLLFQPFEYYWTGRIYSAGKSWQICIIFYSSIHREKNEWK